MAEGGGLTIRDSIFRDNQGSLGGAIKSEASTTISNSRFSSNHTTSEGGALWIRGPFASLTLTNSIFTNNSADRAGGAIYTIVNGTVRNSVFAGNRATAFGGAIYILRQTTTLENLSLYNNQANEEGGAIYLDQRALVNIRHVTATGNRAPGGGGIQITSTESARFFVNSVFAGNSGGDCSDKTGMIAASQVTNTWIQDGSCNATFSGDPMLAPPRGSPFYMPPYIGSPLVDAAPDDSNCLDTDIRGVERPFGDACDIGAYEGAVARPKPKSERGSPAILPTPIPPTPPATCETNLPHGLTVKPAYAGMQCREILTDQAIGNDAIVAEGWLAALDIWGWVGGAGTEICFNQNGKLVLLDAATAPRTRVDLATYSRDSRTCARIYRTGTVVLLPSAGSPPAVAPRTAPDSRDLRNCMVVTTALLNLRATPAGQVIGYAPYPARLTALARTDDWFRVDNNGEDGWISAEYVEPEGNCD